MIKIENTTTYGLEEAIRGMRNPMNSWSRSDSHSEEDNYILGVNDYKLAARLAGAGAVHGKYRRMITVYTDITAPIYWWKEFDTYKVGTVANSCSTMHKIAEKEFTLDDFSHEHLFAGYYIQLEQIIKNLNNARNAYLNGAEGIEPKNKNFWWQMIQLLPSSYNQKRTVMLNYQVLAGIYISRKDHKLDEWHGFCGWIDGLPYSELITVGA